MGRYERLLYRHCAGFIGWTPYLSGMAMQMGAQRAITIEGSADLERFRPLPAKARLDARARLGIPSHHLVCGVAGTLSWNARQRYSYGLELVEVMRYLRREDVSMLIVGDGNGRDLLEKRTPASVRDRVRFTGRLSGVDLIHAMNAMDIGFITQTLDGLGRYRLTTKLPEYLACGLPVAMSPIPGFYDYALDAGWALPAKHPASTDFHRTCAAWLDTLTHEEVAVKAAFARPLAEQRFDYRMLGKRFARFVVDLLA
ncbi:MAG: glycosyltransferase [Bryobacteraceae bacterium]